MKIAIDAGHGMNNRGTGYDPGAVAEHAGASHAEADIALAYAKTLKFLLANEGVETYLTRVGSADPAPVTARAQRAAAAGCGRFISIHLNASDNAGAHGSETLYRDEVKDRAFAEHLQGALVESAGLRDRGVKRRADLAVLRFAPGPVALVELGFLTNLHDFEYLDERDNRIRICEALASVARAHV